jgi:anti-sigma regulatory factor (Ser/Thr protein kinase)
MEKQVYPAKLENLETMMNFIVERAKALGFDNKKIYQIRLAAEEVLVNVINYAYPDKNGNLQITLRTKGNAGIEVEVADWGLPFDPLAAPEPNTCAPLEEREIGGLGIYLMRKFMDEVYYKREGDRNILTFVKY